MKKALLMTLFLIVSYYVFAQDIPIVIVNRAEDSNGRILVTKFRDL
ncbi:MAG: hypothetical protein RBS16_09710 [Candidatus Cloacimonadales bacterium]|jgi:hypothetical protein|nr:hypothetical protein [Candidatus Cloacimonadota bacterium]MDD2650217.1 hypothetical protein [Candidatus Cloacimonadota bacterium]MDD3501539.1 hypothetical protein [Candidatus Cloacimonadota bacterium]MDX9978289.1 hypothetical protein [Candidatus Cloacimonadales bacterium]